MAVGQCGDGSSACERKSDRASERKSDGASEQKGDSARSGQGESYDVWELKTRWGVSDDFERRPPLSDIRQAVLYCYMLEFQTGSSVERFHLRYAKVLTGHITVVTHTFKFDGRALLGFVDEALDRTWELDDEWLDARLGRYRRT